MNFGDRESVMAPPATFARAVAPLTDADLDVEALPEIADEAACHLPSTAADTPEAANAMAQTRAVDIRPAEASRSEVLRNAQKEADALLEAARRAAEALQTRADALARQRRADAEAWSRSHVAEADEVGTKRLLEADLQARKILDQARADASLLRKEPPPDKPSDPVAAPTDGTGAEPPAGRSRSRVSVLARIAGAVVLLVAVVLGSKLIRSYVAEPFTVESTSMEPSLRAGDRLLVDKVAYRLGDAKRGDIVVLDTSLMPGTSAELGKTVVKRVVGLPGDIIGAQNGRLTIDGSPIDQPWLGDVQTASFGPVEVPDDMVFVLGDNRELSVDSRTFGPVPIDAVLGRVEAVIWPPDHVGRV